jgi:hypothetical protein
MRSTNLTDLPTELLSNIMRQLHGTTRQHTLLALCMVNRRLSAIVRDELYTSPSISSTWAPQVVAQLIDRTKTAAKTTQLTIQHIQTEKEAMTTSFMDGDLGGSGFAGRKSVQALNIQYQDALQSHGIRRSWTLVERPSVGGQFCLPCFHTCYHASSKKIDALTPIRKCFSSAEGEVWPTTATMLIYFMSSGTCPPEA